MENNKEYRLAYKPTRYAGFNKQLLDIKYVCPSCGCEWWIYHDRTGTKKLNQDQYKFKCKECGLFFICNKNEITEILGG